MVRRVMLITSPAPPKEATVRRPRAAHPYRDQQLFRLRWAQQRAGGETIFMTMTDQRQISSSMGGIAFRLTVLLTVLPSIGFAAAIYLMWGVGNMVVVRTADRLHLEWAGTNLRRPSCDIECELHLPPLRQPSAPHRRSQHEQLPLWLAGFWRGLEQQPPCVPHFGEVRAEMVAGGRRLDATVATGANEAVVGG